MQRHSQAEAPPSLETVRERLAARRPGGVEEEAEAAVETVREEPPAYLLGGAVPDAVACVVAGLLPVAVFACTIHHRVTTDATLWLLVAASLVYTADWVAYFVMLRGYRTARIALALTLCLFTLIAMLVLGAVAYGLMFPSSLLVGFDGNPRLFAVPAIGLFALQVVAIVLAYRKR